MPNFNEFYEYLSKELYGDEATRHDKSNTKRRLEPVFEGEKVLDIKDKKLSVNFLEAFYSQWESNTEKREQLQYYKDKIKEIKRENNDYDYINNLYQNKIQEFIEYKNSCDEHLKNELEKNICDTDIYKKLEYENKQLNSIAVNCVRMNEEIDKLKESNAHLCAQHSGDILELKEENDNMRSKLMKTLRTKITKELEKEHNDEIKTLKNKIKKLTISLKKAQEQLFDNELEDC
jgi:hypothetical protein